MNEQRKSPLLMNLVAMNTKLALMINQTLIINQDSPDEKNIGWNHWYIFVVVMWALSPGSFFLNSSSVIAKLHKTASLETHFDVPLIEGFFQNIGALYKPN